MEENTATIKHQEFEYKAEMKQLLNLIIHSLYSKPDIFIRELVSNASDALNKYRFLRLTCNDTIRPEDEPEIRISLDKDSKTFSIEDNGIGMTFDDLVSNIGTVAGSGTLKFLEQLKDNPGGLDARMIGKFGVGFYSVFMVTDHVTIETRHARNDSKAYRWESLGEDRFTIDEIDRENKGTKISFKLKDEYVQFAEDFSVKQILNKYSNFVDFPVFVGEEKINKVAAIWQRKKEEVSEEELNEFYQFISNDYQPPLGHLHLSLEGTVNFKALLFIPSTAPMQLFVDTREKSLHLYSSKVFIQDDAKDLLPEYLRFVKGVVDTEDLPLNVSREVTQSSPVMAKIRGVLTTKILNLLEEWADKDKEKFEEFYRNFGPLFKTGLNSDYTNKQKITELIRFETSALKAGELTSFNGYVSRMKADQKTIYYISGTHRDQIEKNPNIEYFIKNGIEVIYLTDPVDIFTIPYIRDYSGKELQSIEKADLDLIKPEKEEEKQAEFDSLLKRFKEVLKDKVEDVIPSLRLVNSPATLVVGKEGLDPQMEKMMQMMDKQFTASKRILEVNTAHPLISNLFARLSANPGDEKIDRAINQIFEASMLIEGYMKSPVEFVNRMYDFMEEATK